MNVAAAAPTPASSLKSAFPKIARWGALLDPCKTEVLSALFFHRVTSPPGRSIRETCVKVCVTVSYCVGRAEERRRLLLMWLWSVSSSFGACSLGRKKKKKKKGKKVNDFSLGRRAFSPRPGGRGEAYAMKQCLPLRRRDES
jgi:hypothetical protein